MDYHGRGHLSEAVSLYEQILKIDPDLPDLKTNLALACYNLGNAAARVGDLTGATSRYQRSISAAPDFAEAHANLVRVLLARNLTDDALRAAISGSQQSRSPQLRRLLVRCAGDASTDLQGLREAVSLAFSEGWARPSEIARAAAPLLRRDLKTASLSSLSDNQLLHAHLVSAPITDQELENKLIAMRSQLTLAGGGSLALICSVASQCFINEYIWPITADEAATVADLRAEIENPAGERRDGFSKIAVLAMYLPLHKRPDSERLQTLEMPDCLRQLVHREVSEVIEERRYRHEVVRLGSISDVTSLAVQEQYEANPYPRWIVPDQVEATTPAAFLQRAFPGGRVVAPASGTTAILIAGCGTGQHSITTARRFPDACVTALDLSSASLAYALRKSHELGLDRITYRQADILGLSGWPERFDIIEASGVMHHLRHPLDGWAVLAGLLKPNGLMRVGLYSERGRRHVVAARALIERAQFRADAEGIRAARDALKSLSADDIASGVTFSPDFYTQSSCRDLLFHVQEHLTSLPEIGLALAQLQLRL
ncbi:MAG: methyltransferase domain-containing protein, partial [Janthinobacterium lividum]